MPEEKKEPEVGDIVALRHGPFVSSWRVVTVTGRGARLEYDGHVGFMGFKNPLHAPDGLQLTVDSKQEFVGRAHFASLSTYQAFIGNNPVE
jgi:hypothetical protein